MDIADRSDIEIENYHISAIKKSLRRGLKNDGLVPIGACYNCGTEIEKPKLFCDSECAIEYDIRMKKINK